VRKRRIKASKLAFIAVCHNAGIHSCVAFFNEILTENELEDKEEVSNYQDA